ncbi:MAG: hypothetical protein QXV32_05665 [Conexivisphaerales archaeon]
MSRWAKKRKGISILIEAVVVTILIIGAFSVAYYYSIPANTRLQRSQTDISQTAYNILSSLARAHEFDNTIINGETIVSYYSNCVFSQPMVSASPVSVWGSPGSSAVYTLTIVNNDKFCGNELFLVSVSVPSPQWNYSLSQSLINIPSNGGTASTQLLVISPPTLGNSGGFTINVNVSNIAINVPHNSASAATNVYFDVNSAVQCVYNNPGISVQPNTQTSLPNQTVSYAVVVTNNDQNCGMENFQIALRPLANWSGSVAQSNLQIASQGNASTTLYVALTSSTTKTKGVLVTVVNSANQYSQSSLIVGYSKGGSTASCKYLGKPTLSGGPSSATVQPYANVSKAVIISVPDRNGCNETFNLAFSINGASGWTVKLSTYSATLSEPPNVGYGPKGGFTLYVSPLPNASPILKVTITATSVQNSSLYNSITYTFTLGNQPVCQRSNPAFSLSPPIIWGNNGSTSTYTLTVTNNNNMYCDNGTGSFNVNVVSSGQLQVTVKNTLSIGDGQSVSIPVQVNTSSTAVPGVYSFNITVNDNANGSFQSTFSGYYKVIPQCLDITYTCLQQIGAFYPNWQHNLNVALASIIPKGYLYNLSVYLVYTPPDNPFDARLIPLTGNQTITDANAQAFANAANVASATYTYTIPSLMVLEFNLQLAEVTSP